MALSYDSFSKLQNYFSYFCNIMTIELNESTKGMNIQKLKCIYKIVCRVNNKVYIGSSIGFGKRFNKHKRFLILNKHHSIALQNSFNKYGIESFYVEILEVDCLNLQEREQYYIDSYQSYKRNKGYNILKDAYRGILGFKHSEETKYIISKLGKRKNNIGEILCRKCKFQYVRPIKKESKHSIFNKRIFFSYKPVNISYDLLYEYYIVMNLTKKEISLKIGCAERTVKKYLCNYNIKKSKDLFIKLMDRVGKGKNKKI